jgi:8-oxo-dGTP diphosphatase
MTTLIADNRILLLKRGQSPYRGSWSWPGGFVESGESLETAAAREIKEEVGIAVPIEKLMPHGVVSLPAMNQVYVLFIAVLDHALPLDPQLPEALEARWFLEEEYPARDIWAPAQNFDVSRLFERARSGRLDIYQHSDASFRVIMQDSRIVYLWRR